MFENSFRRFFILQWKNLLLKKRHWLLTLCEIVIPTLLFVSIVAIRNTGGDDVSFSELMIRTIYIRPQSTHKERNKKKTLHKQITHLRHV